MSESRGMAGVHRYKPFQERFEVLLENRTWPDRNIAVPPMWCSVDLRDGNQALANPMDPERKLRFFEELVRIGFKEIEIGFPSASETEFAFARDLIDGKKIPDDVTPQVLVQARADLIKETFRALAGVKRAIVHVYNSTSVQQREVVFAGMSDDEILALAVDGTKLIKQFAAQSQSEIVLEYSPESFSGTELPYAKKVCEAVMDAWGPTPENRIILNLPATVEMAGPHVYADQIEWFCRNIKNRDSVIISVHPHNDRGTAVAAAEFALMAGADRLEGTLFGNGERTGNVDIVTVALNMFSQGVNPGLDFNEIPKIRCVSEDCTGMPVPPRHPYAGDLVFTAFSGSHQDAIRKGMLRQREDGLWNVPYLHIKPDDIGRCYEPIVRINSQSGKGGIAYVMKAEYKINMPKDMQREFAQVVQRFSDAKGEEVQKDELLYEFEREYIKRDTPYSLSDFKAVQEQTKRWKCSMSIGVNSVLREIEGVGNGSVDACRHALIANGFPAFEIEDYAEHARGEGSDAEAVAFVKIRRGSKDVFWGVGTDSDIPTATVKAVVSALNRSVYALGEKA